MTTNPPIRPIGFTREFLHGIGNRAENLCLAGQTLRSRPSPVGQSKHESNVHWSRSVSRSGPARIDLTPFIRWASNPLTSGLGIRIEGLSPRSDDAAATKSVG